MQDRYLFRAKRTDTGEWVEGYYALIGNKHDVGVKSPSIVP